LGQLWAEPPQQSLEIASRIDAHSGESLGIDRTLTNLTGTAMRTFLAAFCKAQPWCHEFNNKWLLG